jgi:hypothetical protein
MAKLAERRSFDAIELRELRTSLGLRDLYLETDYHILRKRHHPSAKKQGMDQTVSSVFGLDATASGRIG